MKVFDKEVKQCSDCVFSFGKSEKNTSPYLYCGEIKEYLDNNGVDFIHKDCPFKTENSFTKDQFRSIGFIWDESNDLTKTLIGHEKIKGYRLVKRNNTFLLLTFFFGEENLPKPTNIKSTSFPHLKFILDSLI